MLHGKKLKIAFCLHKPIDFVKEIKLEIFHLNRLLD